DEKIYFLIRKLFYLYWISGVSLSKLKHIVMELILMIKGKKKINEIEKFIHTKLKEDNIKDLLKISLTTDVYDTKWIKPLLILLEYSMHDNNVAFIELGRYFYIEHLLPEKWNRKGLHWSKHWNEEDANNCLNKLGNLTLSLGKKDTIELNRDFDDKKKNYKNLGEFAFSLTRELLDVRQWKSWDQNHFKKRQELLLGRVRNLFDFDF
ncbi:MAG TPA: HNH endonuclease family protein, partial [Leptospiraceae bacterium]|nr:HNH endonuclease family protein [Leptospiraceae bacterium]